jgi:FtsH-binding integral membrane protein
MHSNAQIAQPVSYTQAQQLIPKAMLYTMANLAFMALGTFLSIYFAWPIMTLLPALVPTLLLVGILYINMSAALGKPTDENLSSLRMTGFALFVWLGYTVSPFIAHFIFFIPNGPLLLAMAGVTTLLLSLSVALFAHIEIGHGNADKYMMMRPLLGNFILAIILIGLLNSFFQMPLLLLIQGVGGAFLFSLYLLGDIVQHIKMSELVSDARENFKDIICIISGVSIALDIANIFISVLKIMAACSAKENKGSIGSDLYKIGRALIGPIIALGAILGINYLFSSAKESNKGDTPPVTPVNSNGLENQQPVATGYRGAGNNNSAIPVATAVNNL